MDNGLYVNPKSVMGSKFTKPRKKDLVRQRVALSRKRENGLFVNKQKEMQLAAHLHTTNPVEDSDECETYDPA